MQAHIEIYTPQRSVEKQESIRQEILDVLQSVTLLPLYTKTLFQLVLTFR